MICTMADVDVLNAPGFVLSGNNNHNKFILFQRQRRSEYIKCKVTLLYHYIEIKASSLFRVFLKCHCLYNYFNIPYLIKVKLLFSPLFFTIISCIITDYHNLADKLPIKEVCLFDSLRPMNNLSVIKGRVFLG